MSRARALVFVLLGALVAAVVSADPSAADNAFPRIHNANAAGKCIGLSNDWAGDWTCTHNPDQTWTQLTSTSRVGYVSVSVVYNGQTYSSAGYVTFYQVSDVDQNGNQRCLSVDSGYTTPKAQLRGWPCGSQTDDQYWGIVHLSFQPNNYFYLVNYKSFLVAGVSGGSTNNGAPVVQYTWLPHTDQWWYGAQ